MSEHSRRGVLRGVATAAAGLTAGSGLAALQGIGTPTAASAAVEVTGACAPALGPVTVRPTDPQYQDLVRRGQKRYVASPDYVRVVGSTEQVVAAVQEAVRANRRIAVRSGGHCVENFVDNPEIRAIIDLSGMTQVYFDPERNAFAVEGGALLSEVYRRLFLGWGVVIPAGWCPKVGAGGHICGGGYGVLSRAYGLAADYLHAVEVVVVDATGTAKAVVATRDPADPNHDLWWAHTGGGGGNFGVVTRYWLRTAGATSTDPRALLPPAPAATLDFACGWSWTGLDEQRFARLVANQGMWCERNSAPGSAATNRLYAELVLRRRATGGHVLTGQVFGPNAEQLLNDYLAALSDGVGAPVGLVTESKPWLIAAMNGPDETRKFRLKIKSGYLRSRFTDAQVSTIYQQFTKESDPELLLGSVGLATYGGNINATPSDTTATAHRNKIIKLTYVTAWNNPAKDADYDDWLRELYRNVYAGTGGVPDPQDGAYVNYPDKDLADPAQNTSGVPWYTLYYKDNYPRLQAAKARWDPRDVFHHALAIRPA